MHDLVSEVTGNFHPTPREYLALFSCSKFKATPCLLVGADLPGGVGAIQAAAAQQGGEERGHRLLCEAADWPPTLWG